MAAEAIAGLIAVGLVVAKIIDYFVTKRNSKELMDKFDKLIQPLNTNLEITKRLWELHNKFDDNGVPLWYIPRSMGDIQKEIVGTQYKITNALEAICQTLKRMEEHQFRSRE